VKINAVKAGGDAVIRSVTTEAQAALSAKLGLPSDEARLEVRMLLQSALKKDRAWLISHELDALHADSHQDFQALLERRLKGEPIAYILGKREFFGLDLMVTPDTLIPRPDTETIVEAALEKIPEHQACRVLDLGTGTGAIALAIARQRSNALITAVDASVHALQVAQANAAALGCGHVELLASDWCSALGDRQFDVIVSNPPYIPEHDPHLQQGDLRFEPISALASGPDGLDAIRRILLAAPNHLKHHGWFLLEHGYDQSNDVRMLLNQAGFDEVRSIRDLGGIERVTLGRRQPH
jgi:release factor glutamine methyltransferase